MNTVTFMGDKIALAGDFPQKGEVLTTPAMTSVSLAPLTISEKQADFKLIYLFPSVDTPVCSSSTKVISELAELKSESVDVYTVSTDLPFALARYQESEGVEGVEQLSVFKNPELLKTFGTQFEEHALFGLSARAVILLDSNNVVLHSELVSEVTEEPNYNAIVEALKA